MLNKQTSRLHRKASTQFGYFTAKQAISCGFSASNQTYHFNCGHWERIDKGLYRLPDQETSFESELTRWLLWSRNNRDLPQARVSHETALALYGIGDSMASEVHLSVPPRFQKKPPPGVALHKRELRRVAVRRWQGFPVTTPVQTLSDLLGKAETGRWKGWAVSMLSRGLVEEADFAVHNLLFPEEAEARHAASTGAEIKTRGGYGMTSGIRQVGRWELRRAQAGFTLVELLVVVAIISILASLLMPTLRAAVETSRQMVCANNLRQINLAMVNYGDSWNNWITPGLQSASYCWFNLLSESKNFSSYTYAGGPALPNTNFGLLYPQSFKCPSESIGFGYYGATPPGFTYTHYAANSWLMGTYGAAPYDIYHRWSCITAASKTIFITDNAVYNNSTCSYLKYMSYRHAGGVENTYITGGDASARTPTGKTNVMYADGHVEAKRYLEFERRTTEAADTNTSYPTRDVGYKR
jgi:prepilin-type N-terminal cleavage/methylation domain-containing protein/prepilin-type processing-associated H-X9-DG protein